MRSRVAACLVAGLVASAVGGAAGGHQSIPGWFDLPVQGGASTLAALGIDVDERALTLSILARALHDRETTLTATPRAVPQLLAATTTPPVGADVARELIEIPAPLDEVTWRELLAVPPDSDLFARFLSDRAALLLAAGLTATDASIRALAARDRDLLRFLYRAAPGAFLIASRGLVVRDDQVVAPGGEAGRLVWTQLTGQPLTQPAAFIRALLSRDRGRLAWYFDAIGGLSDARLAAAWPGASAGERAAQGQALYEVFRDADGHWRADQQPFRRAQADGWMVLSLTNLSGASPSGSLPAAVWNRLFTLDLLKRDSAVSLLGRGDDRLTLLALTRAIALNPPRHRRRQFEMFRLGQRVFPDRTDDRAAIASALSGYDRFPALLLALERMQISDPVTWARAVEAAAHITDHADDTRESLSAFQASIALVDRLRHVRTLDATAADRAIGRLSDAVQSSAAVPVAVSTWLVDDLLPLVPPLERPDAWTGTTAYESRLLQALAGRPGGTWPTLEWEGLTYTVDLVAAEHARLRAVRRLVPSPGLDAAVASRRPKALADALTALVYAVALGQADGAVMLGRDVATRHDFGLRSSSLMRRLVPWSPPEERQGSGAWHVSGALVGLDAALARLALRRVADQQMPQAPTMTLNDFATLTRTIVNLVPHDLLDADRDAIAAAIGRGRQRVADAGDDGAAIDALAREVRMSATTRELLPWMVSRHPDAGAGSFSLRDLLWLGSPTIDAVALDRWGVAADALDGRRVTLMPPPAPWEDFAGRPDAGQIATQVPDVTLRLIEESARLRLPALLVPSLLAYAVQDYWHDVQARFADDWPRMTRKAAALDATRVEDYVAALVGDGVLRPQ